jgi:hypothetical protein
MKVSLLATTTLTLALTACAFGQVEGSGSESKVSTQPLALDSRDALLAALGSLTLDCLGGVNKTSYVVDRSGALVRNFAACSGRNGASVLQQIDAILGVARSRQGQADGLAQHYAATWSKFQREFPPEITTCPSWKLSGVINPPTRENVQRSIEQVGKESYVFQVTEDRQCGGDPGCVVDHAMACAAGFGNQFLVRGDAQTSTVEVDPVWWLTRYVYPSPGDNPFKMPGYYHAMSYYGDLPGAVYGSLARQGEACSEYLDGKHYIDRVLVPIDCGGGWQCMTYCMAPPPGWYAKPACCGGGSDAQPTWTAEECPCD